MTGSDRSATCFEPPSDPQSEMGRLAFLKELAKEDDALRFFETEGSMEGAASGIPEIGVRAHLATAKAIFRQRERTPAVSIFACGPPFSIGTGLSCLLTDGAPDCMTHGNRRPRRSK